MSFNKDGLMDLDEALRMLELLSNESGSDFHMMVENKGTKLTGESKRLFQGGLEMLDIGGYYYTADVLSTPGSSKGQVRALPFIVVRDCDAATASIASLMNSQDNQLIVNVLVFKASGDGGQDLQPFIEIELRGARICNHAIVTGGRPKRPCEIVVFQFREIELKTAPQLLSGLRGAVRAAKLTNK